MSPTTSVRLGFSRVNSDGKVVSVWNFDDFDAVFKSTESVDYVVSADNADSPSDGLGPDSMAHLRLISPRNLAEELALEEDTPVVETGVAREITVPLTEPVVQNDGSKVNVFSETEDEESSLLQSRDDTLSERMQDVLQHLTFLRHIPLQPRLQRICSTALQASYLLLHSGHGSGDGAESYSAMPHLEEDNTLESPYPMLPSLEVATDFISDYGSVSSNVWSEMGDGGITANGTHIMLFSNLLLLHLLVSEFKATPETHYLLLKRMLQCYFER